MKKWLRWMLTNPNTLGIFEQEIHSKIAGWTLCTPRVAYSGIAGAGPI